MNKITYEFSTKTILDTTTFCNYHRAFVDFCKKEFSHGTFHFYFQEGKQGLALFETDGKIISEYEFKQALRAAP